MNSDVKSQPDESLWNISEAVLAKKVIINADIVNVLLGELECGKENGIHNTGPSHGNAKAYITISKSWVLGHTRLTAIHPRAVEGDLGPCSLLTSAYETIALIDALCRVNRENLSNRSAIKFRFRLSMSTYTCPAHKPAQSPCHHYSRRRGGRASAGV